MRWLPSPVFSIIPISRLRLRLLSPGGPRRTDTPKLGPGPIAAIRFKWTVRAEDNGECYVDETIGENSRPVATGPMSADEATKLVDDRASEARRDSSCFGPRWPAGARRRIWSARMAARSRDPRRASSQGGTVQSSDAKWNGRSRTPLGEYRTSGRW